MFELLPATRIAKVKKDYTVRYAAAVAWIAGLAGFAWAIVLVPSTYVAWLRADSIERALAGTSDSEEGIEIYDAAVRVVDSVYDVASSSIAHPDAMLDAIDASRGSVAVSSINLTLAVGLPQYEATVVGVAPTRADAVSFAERLRATGLFQAVDVPIASLVKERDAPFTLTAIAPVMPLVQVVPQPTQ